MKQFLNDWGLILVTFLPMVGVLAMLCVGAEGDACDAFLNRAHPLFQMVLSFHINHQGLPPSEFFYAPIKYFLIAIAPGITVAAAKDREHIGALHQLSEKRLSENIAPGHIVNRRL